MQAYVSARFIQSTLIIVCLAGIVLSQLFYDSWKTAFAQTPKVSENILIEPHPLPAQTLKKVSFGLDNLLADVTWLETVQYYGGGVSYEKYRQLPEMMEVTTDMDSRFTYPYTFGLLTLPGEGFVKDAVVLGNKGMANPNTKNDWEIPYYLGLVYHINLHDHLTAAKLFDKASKIPGAPPITKLMAATYYAQANQRQIAYDLYLVVYQTTNNQYIKNQAKLNVDHWKLIFDLEAAAKVYQQKYGRFPNNLPQLVSGGIVKEIPADPINQVLSIDPQTGMVSGATK